MIPTLTSPAESVLRDGFAVVADVVDRLAYAVEPLPGGLDWFEAVGRNVA